MPNLTITAISQPPTFKLIFIKDHNSLDPRPLAKSKQDTN